MPEANLTGEVFTLDAGAGFDEGVVRGDVGGGARLRYAARFELCHGLSAELSAEAIAQGAADLGLLWVIAGRAEGDALAAAGVQLDAQATVDLFDRFGLSADVEAFAEAAVAGRLSVGLDARDIALAAESLLPGPALEVFLAFLREARVEAGVWAKLAFSAMVKARLNVRGSLADDENAGFALELGAEAGLSAGGGYDVYAGVLLDSPKRFFLNAADIVTGTLVEEARPLVPRALRPQLAALEYVLPATLSTAYELGQLTGGDLLGRPEAAGQVLVDCFLAELQRFALDKLGLAAATLVARAIDDVAIDLAGVALTDAERDAATSAVDALIDALEGRPLTFATADAAVPGLGELLEQIAPEARTHWRPLLAVTWLSLAAADAIRQGVVAGEAQASAGLVGLGSAATGVFLVTLPQTPAVVRAELEPLLGEVPDHLDLAAVVDFVVDTRLLPLLEEVVPELFALLELVARETGIAASDFVELALRGTAGDDLSETRLYAALRAVAGTALDDLLVDELLPALDAALPDDADTRVWLDEVARPSLTLMRDFALGRIDDLVSGADVDSAFEESFRAGLSLMIGKIVLSNVVVLGDILLDHVTAELSHAAEELSDAVRSDAADTVAAAVETLAGDLLPPFLPRPATLADASRELAAELLLALSEATSDDVLTDERRAETRRLTTRILFTAYGDADLSSPDALDDFLSQVAACAYVPAPDAVAELVLLQTATLTDQVAVALPRTSLALQRFFLAVTAEPLHQVEVAAGRGLRDARDAIVRLAGRILVLGRAVQHWLEEAARWAHEREAQLDAAAAALRRSRRRREILDRLELDGIREAQRLARLTPGFDQLHPDLQSDALALAAGTFVLAFSVVRPLLDEALRALADVADALAGLFGAAADLDDLLAELADAVNDAVEEAIEDLANLDLPDELSVGDVADAAVDAVTGLPLIRDALRAAFAADDNERAANANRAEAEADRADARGRKRRAELALAQAIVKAPARITICSPHPLATRLEDAWAYGDEVPLRITIRNVPRIAVTPLGRTPGPVLLALNGAPLRLRASAWEVGPGRATLEHTLTTRNSSLRPGVNVLECSYADSAHDPVRATVLFLAHASPPTDGAAAKFDGDTFTIRPGRLPADTDRWRLHETRPRAGDCPPTLTLVDDRGRRRAEQQLEPPPKKPPPTKGPPRRKR